MAEFSNLTTQAVAQNGDVQFSNGRSTCSVKHREGSGVFRLKGSGNCCNKARYAVSFFASVNGFSGATSFGIYQDGELLPDTVMSVVTGGTGQVWSLTNGTKEIVVDCGCTDITVRNLTAGAVNVSATNISITRIA